MSLDAIETLPGRAAGAMPAKTGSPGWLESQAPATAVAFGLLCCLILVSPQFLNDPDTQWHVAIGRWIWRHRGFPAVDTFSHTFAGAPWIAKEWLSQLVLFAAREAAGWRGVALVTAAALAATYWVLLAWLARRVRFSAALALTLVAAMLAAPHMLARPHVLVLPVIALWISGLVAALEARRAPPLALALLMALWTNMHGSFPLGLALAGLLAAEGVMMRPGGPRIAALRRWSVFLAAAGGATLLSPYGWDVVLVPLHMKGNAAIPLLTEWQPLAPDATGLVALGLLLVSLPALATDLRANLFRIAADALLAIMTMRYSRFVELFGLVVPILMAGSLAKDWNLPAVPERPLGRWPALSAAVLAMAACAAALAIRPAPDQRMAPEAALRAAMAEGLSGPVYNDYDFGGFLIAHDVKTFVDGRSDQLFRGDFLPRLQKALDRKDGRDFAAILARYGVTWALVRPHSPDAAHLATLPGWSKLHEDEVAAVYAAPSARKVGSIP